MKTIEQVNAARKEIGRRMATTERLSAEQNAMLGGILIALVWVADGLHTSTMDAILAGKPIQGRAHA